MTCAPSRRRTSSPCVETEAAELAVAADDGIGSSNSRGLASHVRAVPCHHRGAVAAERQGVSRSG